MPLALDRREFLAAASGVLLGLAPFRGHASANSLTIAPAATLAEGANWNELRRVFKQRLLRVGDPDFARLAAPWNLRFTSILPAGIARCTSVDDVRTALLWAEANDVPLVARSGGHSYGGFSTTTGLMLDVSPMNQVTYDETSGRAHLGGGARNGNIYAALRPVNRAVTHGRCQGVGVAGLVLGGGIGFNQRHKGLTCDQLVETELLTASGDLLRCNADENSDLFWACRGGGGGNFGINTSFTFQTFPVDVLTVFRLVWTSLLNEIVPALLDLLPTMPDRFGCKFSVDAGQAARLEMIGQIVGTEEDLTQLFAPLYRVARPARADVRTVPYWDGEEFLSEDDTPEFVHERSRYIFRPIAAEGARTMLDFLRSFPGTHAGANWKMFLAGGAVAKVPPSATAFVHRKALMILKHRAQLDGRRRRGDAGAQRDLAGRVSYGHAATHLGRMLSELHRSRRDWLSAGILWFQP